MAPRVSLRGPPSLRGKLWLVLCLLTVARFSALAHDGPEHEIDELSALIAARGESADLLARRAVEYGVLGRDVEAEADLSRAVRLDPEAMPPRRELARVQARLGRVDMALDTLRGALRLPIEEPVDRGSLHILRAEILRSKREVRSALRECDEALRLYQSNPEWYLLRSDLQRRLKMTRRRVAGLEEGFAKTGAGLLDLERVEAWLDDGQYRRALQRLEPELASPRVAPRWYIRQARALEGLGRRDEAEAALRRALDALGPLLASRRPDGALWLDDVEARARLLDWDGARRSLELAERSVREGDEPERERFQVLTAAVKKGRALKP